MEDSLLKTVRHDAGNLTYDCDAFDEQLIPLINEAFSNLWQINVGPAHGFAISGVTEKWEDYTTDIIALGWVKSYINNTVRQVFDPASSSFVQESLKKRADECFWRLQAYSDPPEEE